MNNITSIDLVLCSNALEYGTGTPGRQSRSFVRQLRTHELSISLHKPFLRKRFSYMKINNALTTLMQFFGGVNRKKSRKKIKAQAWKQQHRELASDTKVFKVLPPGNIKS